MKADDENIGGSEVNPVNFRFEGDRVTAQSYAGQARVVLGELKRRMELGGLWQHTCTKQMKDGSVITASSIKGHDGMHDVDRIHIFSPVTVKDIEESIDWLIGFVVIATATDSGLDAIVHGPKHDTEAPDIFNDLAHANGNTAPETSTADDEFRDGVFVPTVEFVDLTMNYDDNTYIVMNGARTRSFTAFYKAPSMVTFADRDKGQDVPSTAIVELFPTLWDADISSDYASEQIAIQDYVNNLINDYEGGTVDISPTRIIRSISNYLSVYGVSSTLFDNDRSILFDLSESSGFISVVPFEVNYSFTDSWKDLRSFDIVDADRPNVSTAFSGVKNVPGFGNLSISAVGGPYLVTSTENESWEYHGFKAQGIVDHGTYDLTGVGHMKVILYTLKGLRFIRNYDFGTEIKQVSKVSIDIGRTFTNNTIDPVIHVTTIK